jgi:thiamine transporter
MKNLSLSIQEMAKMGMLIAMTIVLDTVFKFFQRENGGSINLAMVGIVIIALSFNWWKTWLATAVIYGLVVSLIDGWIQYYPFDYFLALSGFFFISFFRKQILQENKSIGFVFLLLAFTVSFLIRFFFHTVSGVLYFETDIIGSMIYNATYLVPSFFLSLVILGLLLYGDLSKIIKQL